MHHGVTTTNSGSSDIEFYIYPTHSFNGTGSTKIIYLSTRVVSTMISVTL